MVEKTKICVTARRVLLSAAVLCASNVYALGLGNIQVSSSLGEPLKAQVPILQLDDSEVEEVSIRLASLEEYTKHKLHYPDASGFKFQMVSEPGGKRYIRVTSTRPIEEPFLELMIHLSAPSGKINRTFTFLLDPASDAVEAPVVAATEPVARISQAHGATEDAPATTTNSKKAGRKGKSKRKKQSASTEDAPTGAGSFTMSFASDAPVLDKDEIRDTPPKPKAKAKKQRKAVGSSGLALSTSLTISKNDPGRVGSPDAIQEELVVKEKQLRELNSQVTELQTTVKLLQNKVHGGGNTATAPAQQPSPPIPAPAPVPDNSAAAPQTGGTPLPVNPPVIANGEPPAGAAPGPDNAVVAMPDPNAAAASATDATPVTASDVAAAASASEVAQVPNPEPGAEQPASDDPLAAINEYFYEVLAALVLLLLITIGFLVYRKNKGGKEGGWMQQNPFRKAKPTFTVKPPASESVAAAETKTEPVASKPVESKPKTSEFTVKSVSKPVTKEPEEDRVIPPSIKTVEKTARAVTNDSTVPPEYDLLEEADIYLRFGHNKLAEEVLREAIKVNPRNPHSYLTLLGVIEIRGDLKEFEELAKQLRIVADDTDWAKAAEMGRKLDPDNPLYL